MKILFNTYKSAMQMPGGGEVIILKLRQYLERQGLKVDLFNMWEHRFQDYDLIHEFTTFNWDLWYLYKKMKIPFVVTPTMFPSNNPINKLKYQLSIQLKKITQLNQTPYCMNTALSFPQMYFPTTELERERIQYFYNLSNSKFNIVPNGVDDLRGIEGQAPSYDFKEYMLFVGNISPIKRLAELIQVAQKLKKHLVIVGDSHPEHLPYTQHCKSLSNEFIHFMGRIPNASKELIGIYKGAKCVVIPSAFETCSLVGLEAGILGKPVVITEIGGTKEVYNNFVCYHNPQNTSSLATAIEKVWIKNGQDQHLQNHIEKNYLWEKIAKQLIQNYELVLKSGQ